MKTTPAMSGPAPEPRPTCRCRGAHEWAGGKPPTEGCFYEPGPDLVRHGIPTTPESGGRRRAARGAPAAAPPGDEEGEQVTAEVRTLLYGGPHEAVMATRGVKPLLDLIDAGWRLVPPAPPAGHEDEAAVERAARAMFVHDHDGRVKPTDLRALYRDRARAALAAARGPRTPDGPATN